MLASVNIFCQKLKRHCEDILAFYDFHYALIEDKNIFEKLLATNIVKNKHCSTISNETHAAILAWLKVRTDTN